MMILKPIYSFYYLFCVFVEYVIPQLRSGLYCRINEENNKIHDHFDFYKNRFHMFWCGKTLYILTYDNRIFIFFCKRTNSVMGIREFMILLAAGILTIA